MSCAHIIPLWPGCKMHSLARACFSPIRLHLLQVLSVLLKALHDCTLNLVKFLPKFVGHSYSQVNLVTRTSCLCALLSHTGSMGLRHREESLVSLPRLPSATFLSNLLPLAPTPHPTHPPPKGESSIIPLGNQPLQGHA